MNRRQFLQQVARYTAGLTLSAPVFSITGELLAAERGSPVLSVATNTDYTALATAVLQPLGGMAAFVRPGMRVVVKPNIGWDRTPEQGANTHPEVVAAVVRQVLEAGADKVLVFDRTCNEERRCYQNSGIRDALKALKDKRVDLDYVSRRQFVPVRIAGGRTLEEWSFHRDALEADCYINLPVAKHHGLAGLSLGLKNVMGVIGGNRGRIHHNMGQNLADLNTVIRPQLTMIDATRILLRNGPQGGRIEDVRVLDMLIAGQDPVAADAYATTLFDLNADHLESTRAAAALGLGEMDLDRVEIRRA